MKNVLASLILLAIISTVVSAQNITFLPDRSATLIGVFPVHVGFVRDGSGNPIRTKTAQSSGDVITAFGSFRTANGTISYQAISDSIRFTGDPALIDAVPTMTLYAWLADEAVAEGIRRGFTVAPTDCSTPADVRVYADACVQRLGNGLATHFAACDGLYSMWQYYVCQPSTQTCPMIGLASWLHMGDCTGSTCEATCGTGSQQGTSRIQ